METIKNYLDTMFINLPNTAEMLRLKADIFENMQDRYEELKNQEKSENEIIGIVISEFGNIDEILEAMDLKPEEEAEELRELLPVVDDELVASYFEAKKKIGLSIGIGLVSCAFAAASLLICLGVMGPSNRSAMLGLIPLFILLAIGIGFFISGGVLNARYSYLDQPFVLASGIRRKVEEYKEAYTKSFTFSMILGVALSVISLVPLFLVIGLYPDSANRVLVSLGLLLIIVSFGIFFFIYAGNIQAGFSKLLRNGLAEQPSPSKQQNRKIMTKINAIFWPIILLIYFFWSFQSGNWHFTWIIFPLGGIIETIIQGILGFNER